MKPAVFVEFHRATRPHVPDFMYIHHRFRQRGQVAAGLQPRNGEPSGLKLIPMSPG